ncbi:hypothetical protein OEIGOIKO_05808 [Streptomyces chrestomyceticus JCM 4735]|uniref:Uncharacterized protein n=1 Tax=Streptomyces chrestomyceticus JCM 4735 TaxID=1306181 RepID=A0A7U9L0I4_9ACTN|nr:hypothetical protein OEIGOIKO_05808 [Streptomyces chrestomyceticus JCM 4735]
MTTDPIHEIARAVDQLMTQVKHIADHLTPPAMGTGVRAVTRSWLCTAPHARGGRIGVQQQVQSRYSPHTRGWPSPVA